MCYMKLADTCLSSLCLDICKAFKASVLFYYQIVAESCIMWWMEQLKGKLSTEITVKYI